LEEEWLGYFLVSAVTSTLLEEQQSCCLGLLVVVVRLRRIEDGTRGRNFLMTLDMIRERTIHWWRGRSKRISMVQARDER